MRLRESDIHDYARQMLELEGYRAIAVAAQKASGAEKDGKPEEAETWRRVEQALRVMRGPSVS